MMRSARRVQRQYRARAVSVYGHSVLQRSACGFTPACLPACLPAVAALCRLLYCQGRQTSTVRPRAGLGSRRRRAEVGTGLAPSFPAQACTTVVKTDTTKLTSHFTLHTSSTRTPQ